MSHTKIIINPAAGANSSRRKWLHINELLKRLGLHFDFQYTEGVGHAIELAKEAAFKGYEHIVAVGGDGTVHEVANGILGSNTRETTLGIISTGTGSDFIRSVGIPRNYVQACSNLAGPHRLTVDVGTVECCNNGQTVKRYFINSAGIGLDAAVVDATSKIPKYFGGTIPYLFGLFRTLLTYKNKYVVIKSNDKVDTQRIVSVVVANGRYAGGGMKFAPTAELNDGKLDIVVVSDMSKFTLIKAFPRVYKGTHLALPQVTTTKTEVLSIEPAERALVYADGEMLGEGPATFSIIPSALQVAT